MGIRVYLAGRPPVSNMYETVVWVPWCCVLLGLILERVQKSKMLLTCASAVAIFCLILTDLAPTVLDASIQPLEPVLRSTFWLSTHVLIITLSYSAFFLAFALGDLMLFYYLRDENKYAQQIRIGTHSIYRSIQVGIVLLAFGIILGGIWADYSWGRFWGWDPKETWALISLLGYVALLHGRLVGWVKNFQLAAAAVVGFSLIMMSWYGVNFVLGAGLHSYGFGAGGVEYVTGFVVLHFLWVAYVSTVRYQLPKSQTNR
jgi:cytochrome c-type biogenesis protein CcsB